MWQDTFEERKARYEKILSDDPVILKALFSSDKLSAFKDDELFLRTFAPVITEFSNWVLDRALKDGIKRLYFLARDGYLFYLTSKILSEKRKIDLEIKYLKASRFSIRSSEYHLIGEKSLDLICVGGIDISINKILKRANLAENETTLIKEKLAGIRGITGKEELEKEFSKSLNYKQVLALKEELRQIREFLEFTELHSKENYDCTMGYLEKEGLLDNVSCALVDSGWIGTLQQSINVLVRSKKTDAKIKGYYFGLFELPKEIDRQDYNSFYFGPLENTERKIHFANSMFESVVSAPDGMTVGYSKDFEPVESKNKNPNAERLKKEQKLMEAFALAYAEAGAGDEGKMPNPEEAKLSEGILKVLMGSPSRDEIEVFGNRLFCDDILEGQMQPVAAELTEEDIKNQQLLGKTMILAGLKNKEIHESAWIEGSIVKCGKNVTGNLRKAANYKKIMYKRKEQIERKK